MNEYCRKSYMERLVKIQLYIDWCVKLLNVYKALP